MHTWLIAQLYNCTLVHFPSCAIMQASANLRESDVVSGLTTWKECGILEKLFTICSRAGDRQPVHGLFF